MYFEESNPSQLSNVIWEEIDQSDMQSAKVDNLKPSKTSPSFHKGFSNLKNKKEAEKIQRLELGILPQVITEKEEENIKSDENEQIRPKIDSLIRTIRFIFLSILGKDNPMTNIENEIEMLKNDSLSGLDFINKSLKILGKFIFEMKLKKRICMDQLGNKTVEKVFASDDNFKRRKAFQNNPMRESAPENLQISEQELIFKKTVLKERHLKSIVGDKKPRNKKRKRRTKSNQQSLYISNSKKRLKKSVKKAQTKRNKSYNKTKLTLNDNDFSYISSGVDIWGLTRRNKMVELGAKFRGYESGTLDKGIIFSRPFTGKCLLKNDKSKAHFSLRKIGEAPSKLEWFKQMRDKGKKSGRETNSFITGFQSNFIKLSGLRNRSINSGRVSKRNHIKKGSLNRIKQKLKLTAESGSQINKPKRLNPKLDRRILTCFQKSPKLKNKKVSEFIINSPQSLNSMTLLSQKIANTSEMKTWVAKMGENKINENKKVKMKKNLKKLKRLKSKLRSEITLYSPEKNKMDKKNVKKMKKGLKLKNLWNEKPNLKNMFIKIANTTKGNQNNSISFLKIFSTKNGNEIELDKKANKLWQLFKKQKERQKKKTKINLKMKKEENQLKEEGNKFYYDDSNFNSFIKKDKKKLKKKGSKKKKSSKKSDLHLKNFMISEKMCQKLISNSPLYNSGKQSKRLNKSKFVSSRILGLPKENFNPNIPEKKPKKKKLKLKLKSQN
jgi:hypothetical protein